MLDEPTRNTTRLDAVGSELLRSKRVLLGADRALAAALDLGREVHAGARRGST